MGGSKCSNLLDNNFKGNGKGIIMCMGEECTSSMISLITFDDGCDLPCSSYYIPKSDLILRSEIQGD